MALALLEWLKQKHAGSQAPSQNSLMGREHAQAENKDSKVTFSVLLKEVEKAVRSINFKPEPQPKHNCSNFISHSSCGSIRVLCLRLCLSVSPGIYPMRIQPFSSPANTYLSGDFFHQNPQRQITDAVTGSDSAALGNRSDTSEKCGYLHTSRYLKWKWKVYYNSV